MQQRYFLDKLLLLGIYPAVDPLDSTSRILSPDVVGDEHYKTAQRVKELLQRYKELQDIIAILGMDELSEEDKLGCTQSKKGSEIPFSAIPRSRAIYRSSGMSGRYQ